MDPIPTLNSKQFELETDKSDFNSSQFFPSVVFLNNTSWHLHSSRNLVTFHASTFCLQWNVYRPKKNMETRFKIHRQPYIPGTYFLNCCWFCLFWHFPDLFWEGNEFTFNCRSLYLHKISFFTNTFMKYIVMHDPTHSSDTLIRGFTS